MRRAIVFAIVALGGCVDPAGDPRPDGGASTANACENSPRTARRLRRLTRFEYDNTIHDLLGIESTWGRRFPADSVVAGFDNDPASLRVGPLLADKLRAAAEEIAAAVDVKTLLPCPDAPSDDCARSFIRAFGGRAFRRPLAGADVDRYLMLHRNIAAQDGFTEGVRWVIAAMLQSPHFLYRPELGAPAGDAFALTDHEIASELSYLFWASMPDEELFAAAEAGALHTREQIAAAAARLLASPRSRPMLDHFAAGWLGLDAVRAVDRPLASYPGFTPSVREAMVAESFALFDRVARAGRLPELFLSTESDRTDELAAFYGPDAAAHRVGILSHGSLLASLARPDSPSPVLRGKLVRERLLCQPLAPPPPGANLQLPPVDPHASNRERFAAHSKNPYCATCHRLIDPIGFGFERFDAVGRYHETDAAGPIDERGAIVGSPRTDGDFQGVGELAARLAASPDVADCFARQWVTYGYGESADTSCVLEEAGAALRGGGLRVADLLVALTAAADFRLRLPDP